MPDRIHGHERWRARGAVEKTMNGGVRHLAGKIAPDALGPHMAKWKNDLGW